jgi:hypothetical protein
MRNMKLGRILWVALAITTLGCDNTDSSDQEGNENEKGLGNANIGVSTAALSQDDINRVQITVSGDHISHDIIAELANDPETGLWSGAIVDLPAGDDRIFLAEVFNEADTLIYSGSADGVTIVANDTTNVNIFLQQTTTLDSFTNAVPRFSSLIVSDMTVGVGDTVSITAFATDPDSGDTLTYNWSADAGTFSHPGLPTTLWTAPNTEGVYPLTVSATDPKGASATINLEIDVHVYNDVGAAAVNLNINTWPEVQGIIPIPTRIDEGESTSLDLTAIDPDGDALSFSWSTDCDGAFDDFNSEDPTFTLASNNNLDCTLYVIVDDGRGGINQSNITIETGEGIHATQPIIEVIHTNVGGSVTVDGESQHLAEDTTEYREWDTDTEAEVSFSCEIRHPLPEDERERRALLPNLLIKDQPMTFYKEASDSFGTVTLDFGAFGILISDVEITGNEQNVIWSGDEVSSVVSELSLDHALTKTIDIIWSVESSIGRGCGTVELTGRTVSDETFSLTGTVEAQFETNTQDYNERHISSYTIAPEDVNWETGMFAGTGFIQVFPIFSNP